nr:TPA_asm: hypothetical protein HUJ06_017915 [Nelumbo nucifera]
MSNNMNAQPFTLEITVLSAQGLKSISSFLFSQRLRPFIILTTDLSNPSKPDYAGTGRHVYFQTRVDQGGGSNPTWGDKFLLPIDPSFFSRKYCSIDFQIFTKCPLLRKTQLGWCQIPGSDLIEGFRPPGSVRHLSYRVRDRDGSTGEGYVNVAVRWVGPDYSSIPAVCLEKPAPINGLSHVTYFPGSGACGMAIGIPVSMFSSLGEHPPTFQRSHAGGDPDCCGEVGRKAVE